jgi:hypothetical protein
MKKLLTVLVSVLVLGITVQAQQSSQVQGAYIYHFTKYMEWPSHKQSGDFVIAVVGNSSIHPYLKSLAATKKVGSQNIVVKKFSSASAVTNCHMIIVSTEKSNELAVIISKGKQYNALVVTEKNNQVIRGAGMSFVTVGGKAKFQLSELTINKSGIKVSAKLVQMGV